MESASFSLAHPFVLQMNRHEQLPGFHDGADDRCCDDRWLERDGILWLRQRLAGNEELLWLGGMECQFSIAENGDLHKVANITMHDLHAFVDLDPVTFKRFRAVIGDVQCETDFGIIVMRNLVRPVPSPQQPLPSALANFSIPLRASVLSLDKNETAILTFFVPLRVRHAFPFRLHHISVRKPSFHTLDDDDRFDVVHFKEIFLFSRALLKRKSDGAKELRSCQNGRTIGWNAYRAFDGSQVQVRSPLVSQHDGCTSFQFGAHEDGVVRLRMFA
mmetsp:Transcript_12906/g.37469  ORF Transcript_12906/g.37469 Transcript_12906/m.37469 type:complete len:274 (-) Transcript_12906:168-989(-)